jgi:hypothetical protein
MGVITNGQYTNDKGVLTDAKTGQPVVSPTPTPTPTPTPATPAPVAATTGMSTFDPTRPTSSSMATSNVSQGNAMNNAGNAVTAPQDNQNNVIPNINTQTGVNPPPYNPTYNQDPATVQANVDKMTTDRNALVTSSYDQSLAAENALYASQAAQLQHQTQLQHSTWDAVASGMNPYGKTNTSSNLSAYHDQIDSKAALAMNDLTAKASEAQAQLKAGEIDAYLKIQSDMTQYMVDYKKSAAQEQQYMASQNLQAAQYNATYAKSAEEFNVQQQNVAFDNALNFLKTTPYDPTQIDSEVKSGEIYNNVTFQEMFKAMGNDPSKIPAIVDAMKSGSIQAQKLIIAQSQLGINQQNSMTALANATTNSAKAMAYIASTNAANARNDISFQEKQASLAVPKSISDYINANPTLADTSQLTRTVAQMSNVYGKPLDEGDKASANTLSALNGLPSKLDSLFAAGDKLGNPLTNMVNTAIGNPGAINNQTFEGLLDATSPTIAKGIFGETGRLAVQQLSWAKNAIGESSQAAPTRNALGLSILKASYDQIGNTVRKVAGSYNIADVGSQSADTQEQLNSIAIQRFGVSLDGSPVGGTQKSIGGTQKSSGSSYKGFNLPFPY